MFRTLNQPALWAITLSAAGILMVTMGARQSLGLFLSPLNTTTGLGVVSISLAMAVGQFTWGAIQPLAGAVADRYGPGRVLLGGLLLLAFGSAITPFMSSTAGLILSLGLFSAIGSGAGSFSVLIAASSQRLPPAARAAASGVINAGGSFGQFVFAPILQALIQALGWMGAMWSLALMTLAATPLVRVVSRPIEEPQAYPPVRRACGRACVAPSAIAATSCSISDFSAAASTLLFWSPICRARSHSADCRRRSPAGRWRSSA
jgi:MFS family permease